MLNCPYPPYIVTFAILLPLLGLIITPRVLLRRARTDLTPAQAVLYQRYGKILLPGDAEWIVEEEKKGTFVFTAKELKSLYKIRDLTYHAPL